ANILIANSDNGAEPCRYGKLNLILVQSEEAFAGWLLAKRLCCLEKDTQLNDGITRERAVELHVELRNLTKTTFCGKSKKKVL
ncbi:hypothetical protein ACI3PL_14955, partial [Lacticaseibacillus paracasei]